MAALEFKRILCPTDYSDAATGALRAAASLARRFDAHLTIVHIDTVPGSSIPEALLPTPETLATDLSAPVDRPLEEWRSRAISMGAPRVEVRRSVGRAAEEIVAMARAEGADLIVLGTHGRAGIGHFVLGSVAEEVVRHSPCPVLTLGSEAAEALAD